MRKTVTITIGGALYHIEEDAYQALDSYLQSIRQHFASYADHDEIVSDIESRIAEEFSALLKTHKRAAINEDDIETVMKRMGTVKDFEKYGDEPKSHAEKETEAHRLKLYRNADDQIIAGVASGIANYLGIDPLFVRLIFGLSLFMGGFGFVLYIILWIILPEARTTAEKVEMTGGKVTISAIQKRIDQAIPPDKRKSFFRKLFSIPIIIIGSILRFIGKVLRVVLPLIGRLFGVFLMLGTAFAISFATFVLLALVLNPTSPYIGFPIRDVIGSVHFVTLLFSLYFLAFIPLVLILTLAASLTTMRKLLSFPTVAGLIAIWFGALVVSGLIGFSDAPQIEAAVEKYHKEHFATQTQTRDLTGFTGIEVSSDTQFEIQQGNAFNVEVEATVDDLQFLRLSVEEGVLKLDPRERDNHCVMFCFNRSVKLRVTMPLLNSISLDGIANGSIEGFEETAMIFDVSGHSYLEADVEADALEITLDGASTVNLMGSGTNLTAKIDGFSSLNAYDFILQDAHVELNGASHASLDPKNSITGEASGHSVIFYKTEPRTINVETNGASGVMPQHEDWSDDWR